MTDERKNETFLLCRTMALSYVRNVKGRVRFGVHVKAFLPTEGTRGFYSGAYIHVSRAKALSIVDQALSEILSERGGKIQFSINTFGERSRKYISIGGAPDN